MEPLQLGILGVSGFFRKRIAIPVQKSPMIEFRAIASRSLDKAQAAAKQYGIAQAYQSYEDLLADKQVQAVYLPLPNHMHAPYIRQAADAGKHVICEKPIALNATEARECLAYAASKGIKVMEAFMYKFHPQWRHAKELIQMREIGDVQHISTFFGYNNTDPNNIRNMSDAGGGAVLDIGCYAVSCARFLMDAEPQKVVSSGKFDPTFGTDVFMSALMDFGGPTSQFTVGTQIYPGQRVQILGTSGSMVIELPFNTHADVEAVLQVRNSHGTREVLLGPDDQYILEFEAFAQAVLNDEELPVSNSDAISNMLVLDAILESAKSGKWVQLIS